MRIDRRRVNFAALCLLGFSLLSVANAEARHKGSNVDAKKSKSSPAKSKSKGADRTTSSEVANRFSGNVSWYGIPFHGKRTASGRIFDMNRLTCAHRTFPFGTKILVENPKNGNSCIVEVTDRGPFVRTRVLDLSRQAARALGTITGGTAFVNCLVVTDDAQSHKPPEPSAHGPVEAPPPDSKAPASPTSTEDSLQHPS